jgi:D-alanyl-D-alanine carboxypeptidase (penicillin-binding protein 5/6)
VGLVVGYIWYAMSRVWVVDEPVVQYNAPVTRQINLDLPEVGRAAVGYYDKDAPDGMNCRTFGDDRSFPTASMAKLITTLVVLDAHPLNPGEDGPTLTMTQADVDLWNHTINEGGSNVLVKEGEKLTLKQMLQGIMLASGNNIADSLAIWGFGSMDAYHAAARTWLDAHGLTDTQVVGDASGLNAGTVSTSSNLCKLMLIGSENQALTDVMSTAKTAFPVVDELENTNMLLGQHGVFAGKTGYFTEAGHNAILAAKLPLNNGEQVTVSVAVLGQPDRDTLWAEAGALLDSLSGNLTSRVVATPGQDVGDLTSRWHDTAELVIAAELRWFGWIDTPLRPQWTLSFTPGTKVPVDTAVGTITLDDTTVEIVTDRSIPEAPPEWKVRNAFSG